MIRIFKYSVVTLLLAASLLSCKRRTSSEQTSVRAFVSPVVPSVVTDRQEAMEFIALNLWKCLPDTSSSWLSDSVHITGIATEEIEQAMANYCNILQTLPPAIGSKAMDACYKTVSSLKEDDFNAMVKITDHYLYDPNSPLRNEELYLPFVTRLASETRLREDVRDAYEHDRQMCSLNRIGHQAADFSFSDRYGKNYTLHGIKADYTLLFFSNPGCTACKEIIEKLSGIQGIDEMIKSGKLAIVNVYIDEDVAAWMSYMPIYPENWYNGYDTNQIIRDNTLYNVRAIPSLYLLDKDKNVIFKDCPEDIALNYISNL